MFDSKSAKPVDLRLAAGKIQAVEAHREIFAEHVTIPLCPIRTSYSEMAADCDLDTSDFDPQLCQQVRNCSRLDAVSHQRGYALLHRCAILDASESIATPAKRPEAFSSLILETVSQEVFQLIDYIATCKQLQAFHGSRVLRILSEQGTEFINQEFEKHARQRGVHLATSPAHQPQSNGVAERLVGLAKQCTSRLLLAAGLPDFYWSYAIKGALDELGDSLQKIFASRRLEGSCERICPTPGMRGSGQLPTREQLWKQDKRGLDRQKRKLRKTKCWSKERGRRLSSTEGS